MAAQMNYSFSTPKGIAGGLYDISYHEVNTRRNEEADGVMDYGVAVVTGTSKGQSVKLPVAESTKEVFEGITINAVNTEQDMNGKVVVKKDVSLGVIRKGKVWAKTTDSCVPEYGSIAYVVKSGVDAGKFTHLSEGNIDVGVTFGVASDTGIAVIEIR